jgi:hypothetical protein
MLAFAGATMVGAVPVSAGSPGPLTTFVFELNDNCVRGEGAPPTTDIKVTLRGPDGSFRGNDLQTTGGDGSWGYMCFWDDITPGDKLVAKVGTNTRTFTVPPLNFTINRVTDVVSGKTVANSHVELFLWGCQSSWNCDYIGSRIRPTNSNGNFSTDYTSQYNIRGQDQVEIDWYSPQGDTVYRELDTPSMIVGTYYSEVWGDSKPNSDVTVWLFNKAGTQIAKARDHSRWYDGYYETRLGSRDIVPGFFVGSDIASDALWKVFDMNPQFNTAADTINAKCWKNKPFYVYAENIDNGNWFDADGVTDGNGNFSVHTTDYSSFDLRSDDSVQIYCRNPLGDDQDSAFEVP